MKASIAALSVLFAATSAYATAQETQEEPKPEKKICRTEKATGSLTRRTRICLTEAQWRELNSRTQRGFQEMTSGAGGGTNPAQNPANSPAAVGGL